MWDPFAGAQANNAAAHGTTGFPPGTHPSHLSAQGTPMMMPSPAALPGQLQAPTVPYGQPASHPGQQYFPGQQIPQSNLLGVPGQPSAHTLVRQSRSEETTRHHHRTHSNPPPGETNQHHHRRSHSNPPPAEREHHRERTTSNPPIVEKGLFSHFLGGGKKKHEHHSSGHHHHHHSQSQQYHSSGHHHHSHTHHSHAHQRLSNPNPPRPVMTAPQYVQHHSQPQTMQGLVVNPIHHPYPPRHPHPHQLPVMISTPRPRRQPQPLNPHFQYSRCTGRKKALCIGINYFGQEHELKGCINDARHMRNFLIRHYGYQPGDIVLLTDDAKHSRELPTRQNIIDGMYWLVNGAQQNDSLFFHYSGHGGQTKDMDGDEIDGFDEVIYPMDFQKRNSGHIVDDEMHDIMVKSLPPGCRLTALFDSCHSGTVLDLPYIYSSSGRLKGSWVSNRARDRKSSPADVISWSGCKDGQKSADTFKGGVAVGAMSYAFCSALEQNPRQSYQQLLVSIRSILYKKYSQKPQLGSSHPINTSLQFVM